MQKFTPQSLSEFDGHDQDKPIYVAHEGKVYDVSGSKRWRDGLHMKRHQAGHDLSAEISAAPHGPEVLARVTQVGVLVEETGAADPRLPTWLARVLARYPILIRHPHPILVHSPIVFMFSAPGFSILALLTGNRTFETTAFHCLGAGILFTPLTIISGLFTWWLNYQARSMRSVRIKIWGSACLLPMAVIAFIWRWKVPGILDVVTPAYGIYLLLLCSLPLLVSLIGWFGAQLTFPLHKKEGA
jgi:predicted heme/steroid binding protein/uncharacterized membrane protein